jgi:hypothetical protein
MKFTIELRPFIKMIETVGKKMPGQKRSDPNLRLYACAARVFAEANSAVAGLEALSWRTAAARYRVPSFFGCSRHIVTDRI